MLGGPVPLLRVLSCARWSQVPSTPAPARGWHTRMEQPRDGGVGWLVPAPGRGQAAARAGAVGTAPGVPQPGSGGSLSSPGLLKAASGWAHNPSPLTGGRKRKPCTFVLIQEASLASPAHPPTGDSGASPRGQPEVPCTNLRSLNAVGGPSHPAAKDGRVLRRPPAGASQFGVCTGHCSSVPQGFGTWARTAGHVRSECVPSSPRLGPSTPPLLGTQRRASQSFPPTRPRPLPPPSSPACVSGSPPRPGSSLQHHADISAARTCLTVW